MENAVDKETKALSKTESLCYVAYIEKERKEGEALRKEIEATLPTNLLREGLVKIKRARQQGTE